MSFDQILRRSGLANGSTNTEIVGLAFYYLEEYESKEGAKTKEVKEVVERSRTSINGSSVSRSVSNLKNKEWITPIDSGDRFPRYRLTFKAINHYKETLADGDGDDDEESKEGRFIDTDVVEVDYYESLVNNINGSYQNRINDATLILTRKLFENLIIDILRAEFGGPGIDLYYDTEHGRFWGLGTLCGNLGEKVSDLKHYSRQLDNGLINRVEEFKERGNSQAHSVRVGVPDEELEDMKDEATKLTEILYDIREEVRIANG